MGQKKLFEDNFFYIEELIKLIQLKLLPDNKKIIITCSSIFNHPCVLLHGNHELCYYVKPKGGYKNTLSPSLLLTMPI